jgi:predicted Zn-dependent peptidase
MATDRPARVPGTRVPLPAPVGAVHHLALPGADLLLRRKRGVPMVTLGIYAPRVAFDPPDSAGIGALTVRAMLHGADGLDAAALASSFERLGGTLSPGLAADWAGLGTVVLAQYLAEAAALLDRVFRSPALA